MVFHSPTKFFSRGLRNTPTSHRLNAKEAGEISICDCDDDEIECVLQFLEVEDLQIYENDSDRQMTIYDLKFDHNNRMIIHYLVRGNPNLRLLKVKAKKILCELL